MAAQTTEQSLDAWMTRLARGDREAFAPLFRALMPRAVRAARMRLDPSLADDAAQSTLLKVFARAGDFEAGRPVLPWFYAVLANEVRAVKRRQGGLAGDAPDVPTDAPDPEADLIDRELSVALEDAVARLDATSAEAIHAVLGRGPPPVVDPPTLRKRVSRAYARLRLMLGDAHGR